MKHKCLSIAGFDGSGGAGVQADLKTFSALGCYGMNVLTALPVQNTQGVRSCYQLLLSAIQEQLEAIFDDITPNSIKIGMLFNSEIIELVAHFLNKHARNIPIVLDPVMLAKSGDPLLLPEAVDTMKTKLIPLATIITPNLPEAYALTTETEDITQLARNLLELGPNAVLMKGGHGTGSNSSDFYLDKEGHSSWLESPRIDSKNTHGTGCTLSSAIAAFLALGHTLPEACSLAKQYLYNAIEAAKNDSVGKGHGPVHHFHHIWPKL